MLLLHDFNEQNILVDGHIEEMISRFVKKETTIKEKKDIFNKINIDMNLKQVPVLILTNENLNHGGTINKTFFYNEENRENGVPLINLFSINTYGNSYPYITSWISYNTVYNSDKIYNLKDKGFYCKKIYGIWVLIDTELYIDDCFKQFLETDSSICIYKANLHKIDKLYKLATSSNKFKGFYTKYGFISEKYVGLYKGFDKYIQVYLYYNEEGKARRYTIDKIVSLDFENIFIAEVPDIPISKLVIPSEPGAEISDIKDPDHFFTETLTDGNEEFSIISEDKYNEIILPKEKNKYNIQVPYDQSIYLKRRKIKNDTDKHLKFIVNQHNQNIDEKIKSLITALDKK